MNSNSIIMIIVLVVVVIIALTGLVKFKKSADWTSVKGMMTESRIEKVSDSQLQNSGAGNIGRTEYKIILQYSYNIADKDYRGSVLVAGTPNGAPNLTDKKSEAEDIIQQYAEGNEVDIFYNPENPADSALITAKGISIIALIFFGIFIVMVGGLIYGAIYLVNKNS